MKNILFAAACLAPLLSQAQTAPSPEHRFYRLDFALKQFDAGKLSNSRAYSIVVQDGHERASLRAGSKVPVKQDSNYQFIDVGLNIDCNDFSEVDGHLNFRLKVETTSVGGDSQNETSTTPPLLRQNQWDSAVIVQLRKAAILFSSDDTASKATVQLEVLATPVQGAK